MSDLPPNHTRAVAKLKEALEEEVRLLYETPQIIVSSEEQPTHLKKTYVGVKGKVHKSRSRRGTK